MSGTREAHIGIGHIDCRPGLESTAGLLCKRDSHPLIRIDGIGLNQWQHFLQSVVFLEILAGQFPAMASLASARSLRATMARARALS